MKKDPRVDCDLSLHPQQDSVKGWGGQEGSLPPLGSSTENSALWSYN